MATQSSREASTWASQREYDLFLSYGTGERSWGDFTYPICSRLMSMGVVKCLDKQYFEDRKSRKLVLDQAIQRSSFSVVVISKSYVSSKWCLDELVLILEFKRRWGHVVVPFFYEVDPIHVRNQTGEFAQIFQKHENRLKSRLGSDGGEWEAKLEKWRAALREVEQIVYLASADDGIETETTENYCNQNQVAAPGASKRPRETLDIPLEKIEQHIDKTRKQAAKALCVSETTLVKLLKRNGSTWTQFKNEKKQEKISGNSDHVSNTSWHTIFKSSSEHINTVVTVVCQVTSRRKSAAACANMVTTPSLSLPETNDHLSVDDSRPSKKIYFIVSEEINASNNPNLSMPIQPGNANHVSFDTMPHERDVNNTFGLNSSHQYENSALNQAINGNNSASASSLDNTTPLLQNAETSCQFPFQPQNIASPPEKNDEMLTDPTQVYDGTNGQLGFQNQNHNHSQLPVATPTPETGKPELGNANHMSLTTIPHGGDVHNTSENSTTTATNWNNSASANSLDNTTSWLQNGETNCQFPFQPQNITSPPQENIGLSYPDNPGHFDYLNSFMSSVSSELNRHNMLMSHQAAMQNQSSTAPSSIWPDGTLTDPTQVYDGRNGQLGFQNQNQNQLLVATPTPETGKPGERHTVTVLAEYGKKTLKFSLSSESTRDDLEKEVMKRVNLEVGSFYLDYKDEGGRWICIGCDEDLENCIAYARSLNRTDVDMLVNLQ